MARAADPMRRNDILQAARAIFNEQGYNDARMAAIAQKAGVAAGTVYIYFKSKEDLVNALCEDYLSSLHEKVFAELDKTDTKTFIATAVHASLVFAQENRDIVRLLDLRNALGKCCDVLPADKRLIESITQVAQQKMDAGEIREYDPQILAAVVNGIVEWVTKACLVWKNGDIARYEETVIQMLQTALVPEKKRSTGFYMPLMW